MATSGRNRNRQALETQLTAAALTGILAAQRSRPDYRNVCREAVALGTRTALELINPKRTARISKVTR